ncbi:MAG: hypothetical protein WBO35_00400 [Candidatus Saccharimonadales bacterium]
MSAQSAELLLPLHKTLFALGCNEIADKDQPVFLEVIPVEITKTLRDNSPRLFNDAKLGASVLRKALLPVDQISTTVDAVYSLPDEKEQDKNNIHALFASDPPSLFGKQQALLTNYLSRKSMEAPEYLSPVSMRHFLHGGQFGEGHVMYSALLARGVPKKSSKESVRLLARTLRGPVVSIGNHPSPSAQPRIIFDPLTYRFISS